MRHIVYCWEMGEGLGHMVALAKIVKQMQEQGNRVTCILNDLAHAPRLLGPLGVSWLPAPRIAAAAKLAKSVNHADILHHAGYDCADHLHAWLTAWRTMFTLLQPHRIVCEYAPTARLAARSMQIEAVSIDSGFSIRPCPTISTRPCRRSGAVCRSGCLTASSVPFRLDQLPDDVEIGVWHSPTGAVARCLEKGMRMIFLPLHPEQYLAAMAVQRSGLPAHVTVRREKWPEVFDAVRSWPRMTLETRWQPADVPAFAAKLSGT